jgi:transposase
VSESTILEIAPEQQAWMLRELRRGRYGHLLALHILLLLLRGKTPSEIADFLFCSRTSVYRACDAWRDGSLLARWFPAPLAPTSQGVSQPTRWQRSLRWLLKQPPRAFGWCRTRWSCAALALTLTARTGVSWSRETVRRELHQLDYVWKRAKLRAKDDDPERALKLARIRYVWEGLRSAEAFFWADELDIQLLAKVGYQWMPRGTQLEIPTPGKNAKEYLAGALDPQTGRIHYVLGPRKTNLLFRTLLTQLDWVCGKRIKKIYVVADNYKIHKTPQVLRWLAAHPRFEILWLPSYCPAANPIERAFGDVHDKVTRNHTRKTLRWLLWDVKQHLTYNGPWKYKLPSLYAEPEVEVELNKLRQANSLELAA